MDRSSLVFNKIGINDVSVLMIYNLEYYPVFQAV